MSQADELLKSLTKTNSGSHLVNPDLEEHIVIDENRFITVPAPLKRIGVQYDHNIETVTFDCPRYWDGNDLSTMKIFINYMRADKGPGSFLAENITIDEDDENIMHFTWTVSNYATQVKGPLVFLVCARRVDEYGNESNHWNTELNKDMYISEGMECHDPIQMANPEIFTQLLQQMDENENVIKICVNDARSYADQSERAMEASKNYAQQSNASASEVITRIETATQLTQEVRELIDNRVITAGNMYGLGIDSDGNLCVYSNEEDSAPSFEIDENGDLYMLMEVDEYGN